MMSSHPPLMRAQSLRQALSMSQSTFDRYVAEGRFGFPAPIYLGRHRYFNRDAVVEWLSDLPSDHYAMNVLSLSNDIRAFYARELANSLDSDEDTTLGPTDASLCAKALRLYAAVREAGAD